MTADPPVGERELDADDWPVGMTREQILTELGISPERAAECERLAVLSEAEFEDVPRTPAAADWYYHKNTLRPRPVPQDFRPTRRDHGGLRGDR